MSDTFNNTAADIDGFKAEVTYGQVRELAMEGKRAAENDPDGSHLLLSLVSGQAPAHVQVVNDLCTIIVTLLDRLEAAQSEVAA